MRAADLAAREENGHSFIKPEHWKWEACRICGIVRRRDGKNKPCRGPVYITTRGDE
jgi:hypothetical protein